MKNLGNENISFNDTIDEHILRSGDPLDFWRVESIEKNKLLRLCAEMKLPGEAWLQFQVEDIENNKSALIQTDFFEPRGLGGLLYWYLLYPLQGLIFSGMIKSIKKASEKFKSKKNNFIQLKSALIKNKTFIQFREICKTICIYFL